MIITKLTDNFLAINSIGLRKVTIIPACCRQTNADCIFVTVFHEPHFCCLFYIFFPATELTVFPPVVFFSLCLCLVISADNKCSLYRCLYWLNIYFRSFVILRSIYFVSFILKRINVTTAAAMAATQHTTWAKNLLSLFIAHPSSKICCVYCIREHKN